MSHVRHPFMLIPCVLTLFVLIWGVLAPVSAATTTEWVAGGGLGDGTMATSVSVQPRAVVSTADGSVYIADEIFNRIRRVGPDGRVESVVGNGGYGFGQDGLPALAAQLGIVEDLAFDPSGRLFFVDLGHQSVRYVDADGAIQTFATPQAPLFASVPGIFAPVSIAFDAQARLHIADRGTDVVWQIDADGSGRRAGGNGVRGFSGDGGRSALAQLADPRAVAVGSGSIWIADTGNRRVRLITPEGMIHTVAGDGSQDHPVPAQPVAQGAAPLASTGLASAGSSPVRPLTASLKPIDLQVDAAGALYILDELGHQLLRLDGVDPSSPDPAADAVLRVMARFGADAEVAALSISADGTLVVADYAGRRVWRLDPGAADPAQSMLPLAGNGTVRAAGDGSDARNASLYRPTAMAVTRTGQIYFVDGGNGLVRSIDVDGRISTVPIDPPWSVTQPTAVAVDAKGGLYVASMAPAQILYRDRNDRWERVLGAEQLRGPLAITMDLAGRLLVADAGRRQVARLVDGQLQPLAGNGDAAPVGDGGPATQTALLRPVGVAVDAEALWIVDAGAHSLYRLGADGLLRRWAGIGEPGRGPGGSQARTAALNTPWSVVGDGVGGAYVADTGNRRLVHADASGVLSVIDDPGAIQRPAGLTRLASGELLVSDDLTHRIIRLRHDTDVPDLARRLRQVDPTLTTHVVGALRVAGAKQILTIGSPASAQILVRHDEGVLLVHRDGTHQSLLADTPGGDLAALTVPGFGSVVARVSSNRFGRTKPLALIRTDPGVTDQTFDLDDTFSGAEAIAADADGSLYFYQSDGTLLRLAAAGLLNIPGHSGWVGQRQVGERDGLQIWAQVTPGAIALAATGTGTVAAAAANGDIWWLRDSDADGVADERRLLTQLPQQPTSLTILDGQVYVGTADRLYRIHQEGGAELVAEGFAPRLLGLASSDGMLLALEGSATLARVIQIAPADHRLAAWPQVVDFGAVPLGSTVARDVVLRNDGTGSVWLDPGRVAGSGGAAAGSNYALQLDGNRADGIEIAGSGVIEIPPGGSHRLQVARKATRPGTVDDEIRWLSGSGVELLRVPTRIHGLAPQLRVEPDVDFGLTWAGVPTRGAVQLTNEGDAPLMVEQIAADSTSVFSLTHPVQLPLRLEPGESASVDLTFKPVSGADYQASLRIDSDDPVQPHLDLTLRGRGGQALLEFVDVGDILDLGAVPVGTRRRQQLILHNTGEMDLHVGQIVAGTQRLVITPRRLDVPAGGQAHVLVDFQPLVHGPVQGTLRLVTDDPSHPQRLLPYRGSGVTREIELSTAMLDFGPTPWETTSRLQVQITNHRRSQLKLASIRTSRREFRILSRPTSIEPGETQVLRIGYVPSADGVVEGLLTMATNAAEAPNLTVSLRGRPQTVAAAQLGMPSGAQSLWPEARLEVPLIVRGAHDLRGLQVELGDVPAHLQFRGVAIPGGSLLHLHEPPLLIESRGPAGQPQIGLSVAGEGTVTGDGIAAILQFSLGDGAATAPVPPLNVDLTVRGAGGTIDTVTTQVASWPAITRRGDLDGDGALDLDDIFLLLDAFSDRSNYPLDLYDLDGDGQIARGDFDEFVRHLPVRAAARAMGLMDGLPLPLDVALAPPHPNPFNAETMLTVDLPRETAIRVEIHNAVGQRVRTLWSGTRPAGRHRLDWDSRDGEGRQVRTGVYFATLTTPDSHHVQRLLLLR